MCVHVLVLKNRLNTHTVLIACEMKRHSLYIVVLTETHLSGEGPAKESTNVYSIFLEKAN